MKAGDQCWVRFAEKLHTQMESEGTSEITYLLWEIPDAVETSMSVDDLRRPSVWNDMKNGVEYWDTLMRHGILLDFKLNSNGEVSTVTFRKSG